MSQIRIPSEVKSGVCKALKWDQNKGQDFMLYLADSPESAAAVRYLLGQQEPSAVYYKQGYKKPHAYQWRLSKRGFRTIWNDAKVRELEG